MHLLKFVVFRKELNIDISNRKWIYTKILNTFIDFGIDEVDWFVIGGRWCGFLDYMRKQQVSFSDLDWNDLPDFGEGSQYVETGFPTDVIIYDPETDIHIKEYVESIPSQETEFEYDRVLMCVFDNFDAGFYDVLDGFELEDGDVIVQIDIHQ